MAHPIWALFALGALAPQEPGRGEAEAILASAQAAAHRLELQEALDLGRAALRKGAATAGQTWRIHAFLGEVGAALGHRDEASVSFGRALQLFPAYELPPEASPKLKEPFKEARERMGGQRLAVSPRATVLGGGRVRAAVQVEGDLHGLVQAGVLYAREGKQFRPQPLARGDAFSGEWRCRKLPCAYYVSLLDAHGNEVIRAGDAEAPLLVEEPLGSLVALGSPAERPRAWYRQPWPYLVTSVVLGGVAGYFHARRLSGERALARAGSDPGAAKTRASLDRQRKRDYALTWAAGSGAVGAAAVGGVAVLTW